MTSVNTVTVKQYIIKPRRTGEPATRTAARACGVLTGLDRIVQYLVHGLDFLVLRGVQHDDQRPDET